MANQPNINQESMLKTGTVLRGTYRIDGYLSSGGFGNTYVATHTMLGSKLAIKEFFMKGVTQRKDGTCDVIVGNSENDTEFNQQLEKFKKEAKRLYQLDNKNIVKVHDLFEENGTAYYVMDFIDGEDLRHWQERMQRPMTEDEVMILLPQLLDALEGVHAKKLWHLDLKPANIMLDNSGTLKLIDFGASKQFDNNGAVTSSAVAYTNGFAPIEQMERNSKLFGPWTDFYALGASLFCLLTNGNPPLPSDINDDHSNDKHLALPLPNVNTKLRDLIVWLMSPNRNERPQSVAEIKSFMENNLDAADNIGNNHEDTVIEDPDPDPDPDTDPDGRNWFKIILIAIVAGALAFGGYNLWPKVIHKPGPVATDSIVAPLIVADTLISIQLGDSLYSCYYSGEVSESGMPNGKGRARFLKGDSCEGHFVNGNIDGDSISYTLSDGDVFEGSFKNNEFFEGRYTKSEDGRYFVGTFKNFTPDEGQWYDINGKPIATSGNSQNTSTQVSQKAESTNKVMDQPKKPESKKSSTVKENKVKDEIKTQEQVMEEELRKTKTTNEKKTQSGKPGVSGLAGYTLDYWAKPVPNSKWSGRVEVRVTVSASGQITSAKAVSASGDLSDHPEVRRACEQAALKSRFSVPKDTKTENIGSITYIWH